MKHYILLFLLSIGYLCSGQSSTIKNKEIGIISDNDLYTSTYFDRYYTNGTFIYYRYTTQSKKNILKKIREFSAGQKMYTPSPILSDNPTLQDHPYAGYSFIKLKNNYILNENSGLTYAVELGFIGPNSKAQEFQEFIHNIYGFEKAQGWEYQIKNALGINLEFSYLKTISSNQTKRIDFTSETTISAGTILTEMTTSILGRLNLSKNKLNSFSNSVLFKNNLSNNSNINKELFIYIKPKIGYAIYNASIQGSFLNKKSPVTFAITPLILEFETGIHYTTGKWNFKYAAIFYKRKHKEMIEAYQNYGNISIAFQFN